MPVLRGKDARIAYAVAGKAAKRGIIKEAQCDAGANGLYAIYQSHDAEELARIRRRVCVTRFERLKRKADFFSRLAHMAERVSRLPLIP